MYKIVSVVAVSLVVSGCALPVPVQIASWVVDGIVYLNTDKTVTDHGISMVSGQDCALLRGVQGEEVCTTADDENDVEVITLADLGENIPDFAPADSEAIALANFETAAGENTVPQAIEQLDAGFAKTPDLSFAAPKVKTAPKTTERTIYIPEITDVVEFPDFLEEIAEVPVVTEAPKTVEAKPEIAMSPKKIAYSWDYVDATKGPIQN